MKKFIVLICSLVLVFSLIIPVSATERQLTPEELEAKSMDYDFIIVGKLFGDYVMFFADTYSGNPDAISFVCPNLSDTIGYFELCSSEDGYYGEYFYQDGEWVLGGQSDLLAETCTYWDFANDYGGYLEDYIIFEKEVEQPEDEQPLTEIQLLERNNEILTHIYTAILFSVSIAVVVLVVFLLYKFLRKFF